VTGNEIITNNLKVIDMMLQDGASPPLDDYWNPIIELLSQDLDTTTKLLLNCTPDEISMMGGYFEDVSERLQSQEFIVFLKELQQKHPQIDMEMDIQWAIDALD